MAGNRILLAAVAFSLAWTQLGWAESVTYNVDLSGSGYGHIDQNVKDGDGNPLITHGIVACGPTSTVNSLIYLQTRYGIDGLGLKNGSGGYDNIGSDTANQAAVVNAMGVEMKLDGTGVTDQDFIDGKTKYLKDRGLLGTQLKIEYQSKTVGDTTPTWQFIYEQLQAGQDVEVGFVWSTGGGHWVTATGFNFTDKDGDSKIDSDETATMKFIDPWGGEYNSGKLTMRDDGFMDLTYKGGGAGAVGGSGKIDIVVAESPVPLPGIARMGVAMLAGLSATRRRVA